MLYKSSNIIICNNTPEQSSGYSAPEGRACITELQYTHNHSSTWRRAATPSAPEGHFSAINNKTSKNVSKSMIFLAKKHKNQNQQKSTAIFQKSIQMKTHFSSTKAKVYFLGVSKPNPFSHRQRQMMR